MPCIGDAFVQTNWSADQRLQFCVAMDLVPLQRLLDHEEVKFIQLFQAGGVLEFVGAVGVNREQDFRELLPDRGDESHVLSRLDLQLNSLVPTLQLFAYFDDKVLRGFANPQRNAASDFLA